MQKSVRTPSNSSGMQACCIRKNSKAYADAFNLYLFLVYYGYAGKFLALKEFKACAAAR